MKWIALALPLLAVACSAPELTGNDHGGVVTFGTRRADETFHGRGANVGFQMAQDHCARFGRSAQVTGTDASGTLTFACR